MLDGGPSRSSQVVERRASTQFGSSFRHNEGEQSQLAPQPQPVGAPAGQGTPQQKQRTRRRGRLHPLNIWVLAGAALIFIIALGWVWFQGRAFSVVPVQKDRYQAVFMSNGEILFGKLKTLDGVHVELREVFYIRSNTGDSTPANATNDVQAKDGDMQLIKRGDEVHGPEDEMIINREQVLYYENLKPSSKVSQLIQKYMSGNR